MLERRIKQEIRDFLDGDRKEALMVTGARQVGKTYIIRECAKEIYKNIVEINFVENQQAVKLFANTTGSKDILLRLSALTDVPMIPGETLIFFDEVQECPEIVTAIKFLVEDGQYRYILSGSLLGVELKDIRSVPVGYLSILEMYPLDFREFCEANRVSQTVMDKLKECFEKKQPVDELIHEKMMELVRVYLIVGGMPAVVDAYIRTNNLKEVLRIQQGIVQLYYKDIAKYDKDNKLYLDEIFSLIPSELNNKNKRFIIDEPLSLNSLSTFLYRLWHECRSFLSDTFSSPHLHPRPVSPWLLQAVSSPAREPKSHPARIRAATCNMPQMNVS